MTESWTRGAFEVSTDPARLDARAVHEFLKQSYWASERPLAAVEKMRCGSLCFGSSAGPGRSGSRWRAP